MPGTFDNENWKAGQWALWLGSTSAVTVSGFSVKRVHQTFRWKRGDNPRDDYQITVKPREVITREQVSVSFDVRISINASRIGRG